jgi:hypothetical protein
MDRSLCRSDEGMWMQRIAFIFILVLLIGVSSEKMVGAVCHTEQHGWKEMNMLFRWTIEFLSL